MGGGKRWEEGGKEGSPDRAAIRKEQYLQRKERDGEGKGGERGDLLQGLRWR